MIDIDKPEARAKLATLPHTVKGRLDELWVIASHWRAMADRTALDVRAYADDIRHAELTAVMLDAALNAAIVAAFEPLTVHDHSGDVARILGGDV